MRLIDANALIAEYDRVHIGAPGKARKLMEEASTVDAAPVKHAYWIEDDPGCARFCSECGLRFHDDVCMDMYGDYRIKPKYFPTCGSIMDGDSLE